MLSLDGRHGQGVSLSFLILALVVLFLCRLKKDGLVQEEGEELEKNIENAGRYRSVDDKHEPHRLAHVAEVDAGELDGEVAGFRIVRSDAGRTAWACIVAQKSMC